MFKSGSDYMPFFADHGVPSMDFRYTFDAVSTNASPFVVSIRNLAQGLALKVFNFLPQLIFKNFLI